MFKKVFLLTAAIFLLNAPKAFALTFFTDRASWEAAVVSYQNVDIDGQAQEGDDVSSLYLPSHDDLVFDSSFMAINAPRVLSSEGSDYAYAWFEREMSDEWGSYYDWVSNNAFGFEIQPYVTDDTLSSFLEDYTWTDDEGHEFFPDLSIFNAFPVTLYAYDDGYYEGSETPYITQNVNTLGNGSSAFFGWVGGNVWDFEISLDGNWGELYSAYPDGFMMKNIVEGNMASTTTPEPASIVLMGIGLGAGLKFRRKK